MSWLTWPFRIIGFLGWYLYELWRSYFIVARDVVTPGIKMTPGVVAFEPRSRTDVEITLFVIAMTLTPGTFTFAIQRQPNIIYVYGMYYSDRQGLLDEMHSYEDRLLRAFRRVEDQSSEVTR